MKIVNDRIKNALKQPTTQRKGRILINDNYYEVFNVEYYTDAYNEGNVIGNAIASQLDFDLPYIEKFDTFKYFDGIWTGNEYEYVDMGTFTVFDENDEDDFNKHITAFDNLIKFNIPFEESGTYPRTLFQELQNICNQAGVQLINNSIANGNFEVENNQFVNGESLKTVLKEICRISGTYATIKNDGIVLQLKNKTNEVLNSSQHNPVIWKRRSYGINRVILGMENVQGEYVIREDLQDIAENGVHQLIINDNLFAYTQEKRNQLIDELFNQVRGFGYIPYEMEFEWLNYLEVGDIINIDGIETMTLRINGKSPKSLESTMSAPAIIDSSIEYMKNTNNIENNMKRTEIIVDKQNQQIQTLASKTTIVSEEKNGTGIITLENASEGVLHYLSIKGNISLLFPYSGQVLNEGELAPANKEILYPSDNLFPKSNILLIDDTEYKLDFNFLNYLNNEDCDEFVYEDGKCKIIRRLGLDEQGQLYKLQEEIVEERKDIILNIKNNSTIKLKSFDNAIFKTIYLLNNEFTNTFANKVEVKGEINLTYNEFEAKVNSVADEEGNVTSSSIILSINKNESEAVINADKISLEGKEINLTSDDITIKSENFKVDKNGEIMGTAGKIGNWNINETSLWSEIKPLYDYTNSDIERINKIILNEILPSQEDYEKYDFNKDGKIDVLDSLVCKKLIVYGINNSNPAKLIFDTSDWFQPIKIINSYGEILVSFGVHGIIQKETE